MVEAIVVPVEIGQLNADLYSSVVWSKVGLLNFKQYKEKVFQEFEERELEFNNKYPKVTPFANEQVEMEYTKQVQFLGEEEEFNLESFELFGEDGLVEEESLVSGVSIPDTVAQHYESLQHEDISSKDPYSNVIFIDDEEDEEAVGSGEASAEIGVSEDATEEASGYVRDEDGYLYDEDGFIIDEEDESSEEDSDDGLYEDSPKFDEDGFLIEDDDDSSEFEQVSEFAPKPQVSQPRYSGAEDVGIEQARIPRNIPQNPLQNKPVVSQVESRVSSSRNSIDDILDMDMDAPKVRRPQSTSGVTQQQPKPKVQRVEPQEPTQRGIVYYNGMSLRQFLRENPRSSIEVAEKYFSRKEIMKEVQLGRVIKRGKKLFI